MDPQQIRLAFLVGRLTRGGAELQMIALTRRLVRQGFMVEFVCRSGAGPLDAQAETAGASVRVIGHGASAGTARLRRYTRLVGRNVRWVRQARHQRYDIVDAWLHPADVVAAITRPVVRSRVVMSARLGRSPRMRLGPASGLLEAVVNRHIDMVVANADITAADAMEKQGVPAERVRVIRGGVEIPPDYTPEERAVHRAAVGASARQFVIGSVGNFRTMKRQDMLIDAFARLVPDHDHLRLVLVGDGELRPAIERQIRELGLSERVMVFGTATDLPPLYDAFDLFVQSSNSEGLPNVLLEASAAGLPIVATAAGGSGEVVVDGVTGLLVPIDDTDGLEAAMRRAITDDSLRRRIGPSARHKIEHEYGMDRFAQEYAELYRMLLEAKSVGT